MDRAQAFTFLVIFFLMSTSRNVNSSKNDFESCQDTVKRWASYSLDVGTKENKYTLKDLLFFLHIPRTGGRTYSDCFLKKLYAASMKCPVSYDKLHFDPSKPNCKLVTTHDDYSIMSKLPHKRTSVVTVLRSPIDRVLSSYEVAVEVATNYLSLPNMTIAMLMHNRVSAKTGKVTTLHIWPWKYLVPWMMEDLFARREARLKGEFGNITELNNSYNMESILMPIHDFIKDPIVDDIIHNGATFQIAGLTNNSYFVESHEVRHCVRNYKNLGEYVLQVAKERLNNMLYVGLTEEHKESAHMFVNMVGEQVLSQLHGWNYTLNNVTGRREGSNSSSSDSHHDNDHLQMTVQKLMEAYEGCVSSFQKKEVERRDSTLERLSHVKFSKKARSQIPDEVIKKIRSLNNLDMELHKYAQQIFTQQRERMTMKSSKVERENKSFNNSFANTIWKGLQLAISFVLVFVAILITLRKSATKLKI